MHLTELVSEFGQPDSLVDFHTAPGPETTVAGLLDRDFASRFARYDLPQPGGPYKSTPLRRSAPNSSNNAVGAHSGVQTRRRISSSALRIPPTSLTTSSHLPGSRERYCAAAFAADSRASKYLPLLFFSASMSLDRSLAFERLRAACAEHFRQIGPNPLKIKK